MNNQLPKMRTQEDADREQLERLKNDTSGRELLLLMLSNMTGSATRGLPTTDDHIKIASDALNDFRRSDYSDAIDYVESLSLIVDFYKDLAENLASQMGDYGLVINEYGDVSNNPFVLVDGDTYIGKIEVINLEDNERDELWKYYVKDYVPTASKAEKAWISERFADQIEKEQA